MSRFAGFSGDSIRAERLDELAGVTGRSDRRAVRLADLVQPAALDPLVKALSGRGFGPTAANFSGSPHFLRPDAGAFLANGTATALGTAAGTADIERVSPWVCPWDVTIDQIGISCSTAVAASNCKATVYAADSLGRPAAVIGETAAIATDTTGTKVAATNIKLKRGQVYWIGIRFSAAQTLRTIAAPVLSWSSAATPVPSLCLARSLAFALPAAKWTFANSQLSTAAAPLALMRVG